jgi:hypothetical protein
MKITGMEPKAANLFLPLLAVKGCSFCIVFVSKKALYYSTKTYPRLSTAYI